MNFDQILDDFKSERTRLKFELHRIERAMQAQRMSSHAKPDCEIVLPGMKDMPDEQFFLGNQHL